MKKNYEILSSLGFWGTLSSRIHSGKIITTALCMILCFAVITIADAQYTKSDDIKIELTSLSDSKGGPKKLTGAFTKGQKMWINLLVTGLQKNPKQEFDIEADFLMTPSGIKSKSVLDRGKILNQTVPAANSDQLILNFWIQLNKQIKMGPYQVEITLRDKLSQKFNVFIIDFNVMP
jgi:hypothetical protein